MKHLRTTLQVLAGLFFLLVVFIFQPVSAPTASNTVEVKGIVASVYEGGPKDITFRLKDDDSMYYINRGLQYTDLTIKELREQIKNQEVTFTYIKHWSLLNPNGKVRPIAAVKKGEEEIYSRLNAKN